MCGACAPSAARNAAVVAESRTAAAKELSIVIYTPQKPLTLVARAKK